MYEGSNVRDHFPNYCLTNVGRFSCAVDCSLELCYFVFHNHLHNITCNDFFQVIYAVEVVWEPVWSLIRGRCLSFSAMTANAIFSDIFTMQTFRDLTNDFKSLFLIQQCNQTCCTLSNNQIVKTTSTNVLYITCPNILPTQFKTVFQKLLCLIADPFFVIHVKGILVIFQLCNILLPCQNFYQLNYHQLLLVKLFYQQVWKSYFGCGLSTDMAYTWKFTVIFTYWKLLCAVQATVSPLL